MSDFDEIWQKYSEYSRIEFVCFSFHVGLLVITLSSLKLHTENNACVDFSSVRALRGLLLPGRLSAVPNFLNFASNLSVINCRAL